MSVISNKVGLPASLHRLSLQFHNLLDDTDHILFVF